MFKLSALNESADEEAHREIPADKHTKEAQEAYSFKLYNEALRLQQNNRCDEAVTVYEELLQTPLIIESATSLVNEHNEATEHPLKDPGLILKYSAHKNVASICASQGDVNKAMENYLQAVMLDTSDVTLWYKIGVLAAQLSNLHLSRRALTQGLECNSNHWPCLDSLITVCYAILDYENCLEWIAKALQKDPMYKKGIYLRRKMIMECPHLRRDFEYLFRNCGTEVFEMEISDEDAKDILDEALTLRENSRKLCAPPEIPIISLQRPLKSLTFLSLGRSLIATYDYIETQEEPISITNKIDMKIFDANLVHASCKKGGEIFTGQTELTSAKEILDDNTDMVMQVDVNCKMGMDSTPGPTTHASSTSVVMKASGPNVTTESPVVLSSNSITGNSSGIGDGSNSNKKGFRLKKVADKSVEQGRRSERRSARKKHHFQNRTAEAEPGTSPGLDFRRRLLGLLPKTLQPSVPVELDSDTCSQDSALFITPDIMRQQSQNDDDQQSKGGTSVSFSVNVALLAAENSTAEESVNACSQELSVENSLREAVDKSANQTPVITASGTSGSAGTDLCLTEAPQAKKAKISDGIILTDAPMDVDVQSETPKVTTPTKYGLSDPSDIQPDLEVREPISVGAEDSKTSEGKLVNSLMPVDSTSQQAPKVVVSSECAIPVAIDCKLEPVVKMATDEQRDEESEEVTRFIETYNESNGGILELLQLYCKWMGRRSHLIWEEGLKGVFLKAFGITQPSLKVEHFMENNLRNPDKIMFAFYMLTHLECALDEKRKIHILDFGYVPSELEYRDMSYIVDASFHPEVFEEDLMPEYKFKNFILRFHWVRATYFYLSGDKDSAFAELTVCSKLCFAGVEIPLYYLKHDNKIELSLIKKRLELLKRFQILEEVENLHSQERYLDVIKLITSHLDRELYEQEIRDVDVTANSETLEQPQLLDYLLQASAALKESSVLLKNLSIVVHKGVEAFAHLEKKKHSKDARMKYFARSVDNWNSLLNLCCEHLTKNLEANIENLTLLDQDALVKLTNGLVSFIHLNMQNLPARFSQPNLKKSTPSNFLRPWILLHKITVFEEDKSPRLLLDGNFLPGSIKLLLTAHDWLGEKGLCCMDDGGLLRLLLKALFKHMLDAKYIAQNERSFDEKAEHLPESERSPSLEQKKDLQSNIEQCFFCLFGFPNKIARSSALVDHSSQLSALSWKDATLLYGYFKPKVLPGFDSYKIKTMLGDMAALLTRVVSLVPDGILNNLKLSIEILEAFFRENDAEKGLALPSVCDDENLTVMKDIYYLLADYYFKNNEMVQAGKHYLRDLCFNSQRFDSWAGLALVKSSIIDEKLRLSVAKPSPKEQGVLELSKVALLCYKKAMIIENVSTTLWIEYGSLAYWMHSYHSRQKRIRKDISADEAGLLEEQKFLMLDLAEQCFNSALKCDPEDVTTEEWLIQYMLGKVLEKRRESPQKYLPKYSKSTGLLHRKHAKYPKKIQFKSYQSDYAIEALEMYFRLHASMLKLVQNEVNVLDGFEEPTRPRLTKEDYDLFDDLLEEAEEASFVKRESLPYSQLNEKSSDGQSKKQAIAGKLVVPGSGKQSGLTMGSLLPDSIASSIAVSAFTDPVIVDDNSDDNGELLAKTRMEVDSQVSVTHTSTQRHVPDDTSNVKVVSPQYSKPKVVPCSLSNERRLERALQVMKSCVSALQLCLGRLPQHYKSIYRLADLYWRCSARRRHVTWSRDLLLSSESPWQQLPHMPAQGLLNERNKTNLFNGVWKIPVDEIDRPGSFGCHLDRCISLLLDVLLELKDHGKLLYLHNMLNRTPDQGRKYLQDSDRIIACKKAYSYSMVALHNKISNSPFKPSALSSEKGAVSSDERRLTASELLARVIDAGKLYQMKHKISVISNELTSQTSSDTSEPLKDLLLAAFQRYASSCPEAKAIFPNFDHMPRAVRIEMILKFCQHHSAILKTGSAASGTVTSSVIKSGFRTALGPKKSSLQGEKRVSSVQETQRTSIGISATDHRKKTFESSFDKPFAALLKKPGSSLPVGDLTGLVAKNKDLLSNTEVAMNLSTSGGDFPFSSFSKSAVTPDQPWAAFSHLHAAASGGTAPINPVKAPTPKADPPSSKMSDSVLEVFNTEVQSNIRMQSTTTIQTVAVLDADESKERNVDLEKNVPFSPTDNKPTSEPTISPQAEVMTVIKGSETYTKIVPAKPALKLSPSVGSAFTPAVSPQRMKLHPQLEKLTLRNKAPLLRSVSLPEGSNVPGHGSLHRTGSVSEYTKQKLKSSILSRTSASLVRRPSITKRELEQILTDPESSHSEEEEVETLFKPLDAAKEDVASSSKQIDVPVHLTPDSSFPPKDGQN